MKPATIAYIPSSHLDLYWLGNYKTCLERGEYIIQQYLDRCVETRDETFLLETVVFADEFLRKHPEYQPKLVELVHAGRVEVGSVYIDRMETTMPAESLIRNALLGKLWCREVLGIDNPTVTHPDLPSLTPQTPQIYHQLGLKYYVTSRKMFRHGCIWRYRAPDGSRIMMLNWPRHYVFCLMNPSDVATEVFKSLWTPPLDIQETLKGFPLGTVTVSGSAGDLTDRETFRQRYGQYLEDFVSLYRKKYPEYEFTYTIPSKVLSDYDNYPDLPELTGEAPTVWSVDGGEDHRFFTRLYTLESQLLTAESLVALAERLNISWRPPSADQWKGTFHEDIFFARKDPIAPGNELKELWRMHIFTQDHNAAGQEGVLSSFQKQAIQERGLAYTREIIDYCLDQIASSLPGRDKCLLVFNPHGHSWCGTLQVTFPSATWDAGLHPVDELGAALPFQVLNRQDDWVELLLSMPELPPLGYRAFALSKVEPSQTPNPTRIWRDASALHLDNPYLEVDIDLQTGSLKRIFDKHRSQDWGGPHLGQLYSIEECGNDVSMRISPSAAVARATLLGVDLLDSGPLCTRVHIHQQLLKCEVEQTITLSNVEALLDLETRIWWWGKRRQQARLGLSPSINREDMTHGSPFYGTGWTETMEGCGPWNSDEVSPEVQMSYRESIGWLHLCGRNGGLTICSNNIWYHHAQEGLEAVLMRTLPSCGDGRLFLEQPGEHVFTFTLYPCDSNWKVANAQQIASHQLKPPVYRIASASGNGDYSSSRSFLKITDERFALSSLYPGLVEGTVVARIWETTGHAGSVHFSGLLAEGQAEAVNFLEEEGQPLEGSPGSWSLDVPAWGIRTVLFKK